MILETRRREFLARMFTEAMRPYECPGEEWTEEEKEFLPVFMDLVGSGKLILDLAGGYGRITSDLAKNNNTVVLADLSPHSIHLAGDTLREDNVHFVRADVRSLTFRDDTFDGIWFAQAFEYVPPDEREIFLLALRRSLKTGGLVFMNVARIPGEGSRLSYLRNYVHWKLIRREPVVWGEYIYELDFEHYSGSHYHSVVFTRRVEHAFGRASFRILRFSDDRNGYLNYLLQAI